jgi:triacylglycerol lipase
MDRRSFILRVSMARRGLAMFGAAMLLLTSCNAPREGAVPDVRQQRLAPLAAELQAAEDVAAISRLPPIDAQLARPPASAASAPAGMPAEIAAALREIGPRIDSARTAPLYAPLHAGKVHPDVHVRRELSYGPDPKHRADVFTGQVGGSARPVLVFAYGGGFRGAYRSSPDSPFYDNIGYWAAENGLVGITIQYRLAPQFTYPAGAEDIARAVSWVREHARQWGGDPDRLFLWGHSSGAAHVADYLVRTPGAPVRAAILMSGIYDLGTEGPSMWSAYYGEDVSKYAERSSLPRLIELPLPIMAVWAELDAPNFISDSQNLIRGRRQKGRPVVEVFLPNHSHLSEAYAVGTDDVSLTVPLLEFIRDQSAPRR